MPHPSQHAGNGTGRHPIRVQELPKMKKGYLSSLRIVPIMIGLMSGALSIVREFLLFAFPDKYKESSLFWASVRISFVLSAATAWVIEHRLLEKEKARNQKPELDGEIMEAYIGPIGVLPEEYSNDAVVLLAVKAWNKVQMPEVTIRAYEFLVQIGGAKAQSFKGVQEGWSILHYSAGPSIVNIPIALQGLRPVRYLASYSVPDKVGFFVKGLPPDTKSATSLELTLVDFLGGRHTIKKIDSPLKQELQGMPSIRN